jgi:hypothetical protein
MVSVLLGLDDAVDGIEDPGTVRWTSQDPLSFSAGDANLYRYASNNPTGSTDARGLQAVGVVQLPRPGGGQGQQPGGGVLGGLLGKLKKRISDTCTSIIDWLKNWLQRRAQGMLNLMNRLAMRAQTLAQQIKALENQLDNAPPGTMLGPIRLKLDAARDQLDKLAEQWERLEKARLANLALQDLLDRLRRWCVSWGN